jgi:hypothetical protein
MIAGMEITIADWPEFRWIYQGQLLAVRLPAVVRRIKHSGHLGYIRCRIQHLEVITDNGLVLDY